MSLEERFQKFFPEKILQAAEIMHKGNNQLCTAETRKAKYLLKKYSTVQADGWNRGETEFRAISHFWRRGIKEIPQPIGFYAEENTGIYSFENGKVLAPEEVDEMHIEKAARFIAKLHGFGVEDKKAFPKERTPCLRIIDYVALIEKRLETLSRDFDYSKCSKRARNFLDKDIADKVRELKGYILGNGGRFDLEKELTLGEQVITPGDFGFHNMLADNEKCVFLDFEYCGRDDPVKQILDFLHHDQTRTISKSLKNLFVETYRANMQVSEDFDARMRLVDSLIGMNWTLIYMNVVSKNYLQHLQFAHGEIGAVIDERIKKAEEKLKNLKYFD